MKEIKIIDKNIGHNYEPFIIAEMSGNHNRSLERALKIVDAAAEVGVHALKLQTYTADTMTLDICEREFFIADPKSLWKGRSLYDLYKEANTPWEWHQPIFERCAEKGIIAFSSPFDATAVDFLETLNVPCYKIASFENTDLPLIEKVALTGKPVIISTGMASIAEIYEAVSTARKAGCSEIILLKCTSTYPASPKDTNLNTIPHLRQLLNIEVGISDHTLGTGVSIGAVALGATVIEKHFTLDRNDGGVDSVFSMEPAEMKLLCEEARKCWEALGSISYSPTEDEKRSMQYRRTLYVVNDIKEGETFNRNNVRAIRPGRGLPPKFYEAVLGKKVSRSIVKGTPVTWDLVL